MRWGGFIDTISISQSNRGIGVSQARRLLLLMVCTMLLGGCATVTVPRSPSTALGSEAIAETYLGAWARQATKRRDGLNGLRLVSDGRDAFGLRASLAGHAQRTLDVQYYIYETDQAGRALLERMLHAAERGVRVRLLLDDTASLGKQATFAAFDTHPNVEVRVFNPVPTGRGTKVAYHLVLAANFDRLHRRMHNKLWLADGAVGLTGGRNVSDAYFDAGEDINFDDLDVLSVGPVVNAMSDSFDEYWNHSLAIPLSHFERQRPTAWRALLTELVADADDNELADHSSVWRFAGETGRRQLETLDWAPAVALWDSPDKLDTRGYPDLDLTLIQQLGGAFQALERRLLIVSPYVVPTPAGAMYQQLLAERGIEVTIFTNSLAAMDHASLYGAYAPWREPLLRQGARLFEFRGDASARPVIQSRTDRPSSLHTKAMAFDDSRIFIGSMNADPRAVWWNSEIGLLIDSSTLGRQLWDLAKRGMEPRYSYEVRLNEKGELRWLTEVEGHSVVLSKPPGSLWKRFKASAIRLFDIEHLL